MELAGTQRLQDLRWPRNCWAGEARACGCAARKEERWLFTSWRSLLVAVSDVAGRGSDWSGVTMKVQP
ncbi:hypothetical protein NL676_009084 [Syzygium grande]|nr:hypothetical protein NL676_009084 [Syzygium grande]